MTLALPLVIIIIAVIVGYVFLLIPTVVIDPPDRREFNNHETRIKELEDAKQALEDTRGKSFKHAELVDIENAIGSSLKADEEIANIEDLAQIMLLQVRQARKRNGRSYEIFHALRGKDRDQPVSAPRSR
jgi:hypothetical protein